MGTPRFGVPTLQALAAQQHVVGVVTQPDRRAGRGRKAVLSPVKGGCARAWAPALPASGSGQFEAVAHLTEWRPDVIVVAAFGQFVPSAVLELPPHSCLNVHPSLLPKHRGAAPIPAAILAGDSVTGVTVMRMDEGLDTGPVLAQVECTIAPDDTTTTLTARLADMAAATGVGHASSLDRWRDPRAGTE